MEREKSVRYMCDKGKDLNYVSLKTQKERERRGNQST